MVCATQLYRDTLQYDRWDGGTARLAEGDGCGCVHSNQGDWGAACDHGLDSARRPRRLLLLPTALAGVLLPRASGGSQEFRNGLEKLGAEVDEVILYESRPPASSDGEALEILRSGGLDAATFASSSSVRNLAKMLDGDLSSLKDLPVACIGPITAATAREQGLTVDVEPTEHTIAALVEELELHFGKQEL